MSQLTIRASKPQDHFIPFRGPELLVLRLQCAAVPEESGHAQRAGPDDDDRWGSGAGEDAGYCGGDDPTDDSKHHVDGERPGVSLQRTPDQLQLSVPHD